MTIKNGKNLNICSKIEITFTFPYHTKLLQYKMGHISLPLFLTLIQVAFIVLFGVFVRYPPDPQPYMVCA